MAKKKTKRPVKTYKADKTKVLVATLIDRSGSMASNWTEHVNGYRRFVDDLRGNDAVQYTVSLTVFDSTVITPARAVPLAQFDASILEQFPPNDWTALYDALGTTLTDIGSLSKDFDKVIFLVITDGGENSSRKFTKDQIHSMIDERIAQGNWTFEYFGCQPETWSDSAQAGFQAAQTVQYTPQFVGAAYAAMSSGVNNFSNSSHTSARGMTTSFGADNLLKAAHLTVTDPDVFTSSDSKT